ncbi:MAG: leucine-rich repeat domain-containing protein [Paludibacteraceae bacterium]|nr:leucine-rich repeat domain-containing protein [Paludibacteraceae bacterium]
MRKLKLFTLLAGLFLATSMWADPAQIGTTGLYWETTGTGTNLTLNITYNGSGTTVIPNYQLFGTKAPWSSSASSIKSVSLPAELTVIGDYAFNGCKMASITIPAAVTSIGANAFNSCTSLASITFLSSTPCTLGSNVFNGVLVYKLYVPDANAQDYSNAWPAYYGKIYCTTSKELAPAPHGEGNCGASLTWDLTDGVLTISGTGAMTDFASASAQPWKDYTSIITSVVVEDGVTTIGTSAFRGFTKMTSVSLPAGLTTIGANAFYGANNVSFTTITFPASLTSIGNDAFYGCTNIATIYANADPNDLLWNDKGCDDFIKTPKKSTLCYVSAAYFAGYLSKNTGSTSGTSATDINVTFVLTPAFTSGDCSVAVSATDVSHITMTVSGSGAMADYATVDDQPWAMPGITNIVIEEGVTHIGNHAFDGCVTVTSIVAKPTTAPTLGTDAFKDFDADVQVTYPCLGEASYTSAWSIFDGKFGDCMAPANACGDGLTWDLTAGVLTISKSFAGDGSMYDYSTSSINPVPWNASKASITSVVIEEGVTTIGNNAFYALNNNAYTSVTIPSTVTSIGEYAFNTCSKLATVNVLPTTAPTLGANVFSTNYALATINYPCGSDYSSWSDYSSLLTTSCEEPYEENITAHEDPLYPGVYYSTYYHPTKNLALPNNGTEAYVATLSGDEMLLTKIADGEQVLPADNAVILKGSSASYTLTESDNTPVSFTATNNLKGTSATTATVNNYTQQYYVLSGNNTYGVGFYEFNGEIPAHRAYLIVSSSGYALAPTRVRFVFDAATDIENVQGDNVQSTKFIENGMLIIEKNGVRYNAQGQIVK